MTTGETAGRGARVVGRRSVLALAGAGVLGGCSGLRLVEPTPSPSTTAPAEPLPTAAQVLADVRTSALSADSARVVGSLGAGADAPRIELEGTADGSNQRFVRVARGRGLGAVLTVDAEHWLAGDVEWWRGLGVRTTAASRVGRWVRVDADGAERAGRETVRGLVTDLLDAPAVARLGSSADLVVPLELDGRAAWRLGRSRTGARLWVAADGSGDLLRAVVTGTGAVDLSFDAWGRATTWAAPGADERPDLPVPTPPPVLEG
ncbi:hypothetical protein [Arthrobacter sp. NEB 688]|uniref:hypothetical protein n=1 Tax=Arthrobacter sp. NEB 688 TaxID=904039 RepID=UPI0015634198|nr:hypothetical protein [Arthrobacter sp. NEB 688]QKE82511.1 hypothetical protein HL663_00080 [Arthrobacter sp. NEB 688]